MTLRHTAHRRFICLLEPFELLNVAAVVGMVLLGEVTVGTVNRRRVGPSVQSENFKVLGCGWFVPFLPRGGVEDGPAIAIGRPSFRL